MKNPLPILSRTLQAGLLALAVAMPASAQQHSIPFDQLGAEAQKQYAGDGIRIIPTKEGAKLKAIMQDLEAEAVSDGLWLTSIAEEDTGKTNRFRVKAVAVAREGTGSTFDVGHSSFLRRVLFAPARTPSSGCAPG